MEVFHLGVDISKAKFDLALLRPDGKFHSSSVKEDMEQHITYLNEQTTHNL